MLLLRLTVVLSLEGVFVTALTPTVSQIQSQTPGSSGQTHQNSVLIDSSATVISDNSDYSDPSSTLQATVEDLKVELHRATATVTQGSAGSAAADPCACVDSSGTGTPPTVDEKIPDVARNGLNILNVQNSHTALSCYPNAAKVTATLKGPAVRDVAQFLGIALRVLLPKV